MKPRLTIRNEKGGALAITLLLLLGLTALGAVFMTTSRTETQIAGNVMRHTQALYAAEAGLNEAMARLWDSSSPSYVGEDMMTPNAGWGTYIVQASGNSVRDPEYGDAASDGLDNDIDGLADEGEEAYPEVLSAQAGFLEAGNAQPINYPWVRVTYSLDASNNIVRYGDHDDNPRTRPRKNLIEGAPVVTVTSHGERGTSKRTLEVELVKRPGPYVKTCVYTEDDNFKFDGQNFFISGQDFDPALGDTVAGSERVPGILTTESPDTIYNSLDPSQYDQVIGSGGEADIQGTSYDLDLEGYVAHYGPLADFRYVGDISNPNTEGWGGIDDFHIVYVKDGDLHLSGNTTGGGLLLIDQSLIITGQFTWYGLVITLGDINFAGGGGGIHIYGGVLSNGNVTRNDVGGTADIYYSSHTLEKLHDLERFEVLSWNEK